MQKSETVRLSSTTTQIRNDTHPGILPQTIIPGATSNQAGIPPRFARLGLYQSRPFPGVHQLGALSRPQFLGILCVISVVFSHHTFRLPHMAASLITQSTLEYACKKKHSANKTETPEEREKAFFVWREQLKKLRQTPPRIVLSKTKDARCESVYLPV